MYLSTRDNTFLSPCTAASIQNVVQFVAPFLLPIVKLVKFCRSSISQDEFLVSVALMLDDTCISIDPLFYHVEECGIAW